MKHQYFGDVNDYVKYGLLRALHDVAGLRLGVVWMLTPDDDRPDGARTAYRRDPEGWRAYDPELFDRLARLASNPEARNVELFRRWNLVPGALDVGTPLPDGADARTTWMADAREALQDCPLLFFDPDNGFEIESVPFHKRDSVRYLYWDEAAAAWHAGHSLLVYQHFPREARDAFEVRLRDRAATALPGVRLTTLRSTHVLFVLAARPEHADALARAADEAGRRWVDRIAVAHEPPRGDRASDVAAVCAALAAGDPGAAQRELAARWPFAPGDAAAREYAELDALNVWLRDGFIDRYDGTRLVFPGTLLVLSRMLPAEFPDSPDGNVSEMHPAYTQLLPSLDHVRPLEGMGTEDAANAVTISRQSREARAHRTPAEPGWTLSPGGSLPDWDGLTGWFRDTLARQPELLSDPAIGKWAKLLQRATRPD